MKTASPNIEIRPITAAINDQNHLLVGGCDTVELAEQFGTPLWVLDEETIRSAARSCLSSLAGYPKARVFYAGKAFLCLAMCRLIDELGLYLDVVSGGELFTALEAGFPPEKIFFHGNNKSADEIAQILENKKVTIVADSQSELQMIALMAKAAKVRVSLLLRLIPGIETDTHEHIKTGHLESKFGFALHELDAAVKLIKKESDFLDLKGLHAHIGSQTHRIEPYLEMVDVLADCFQELRDKHQLSLSLLDLGGGLGIAYTSDDQPMPIEFWATSLANRVKHAFPERGLALPELALEPGRSIVGPAGITLYRAGHTKTVASGTKYLALDGGMADNPRPITYQARYTACVANRVQAQPAATPLTLVGRYCESGDIIIKETNIAAETGDIIAVFGTGAYNYSMASNYNRTTRPACVLVKDGKADIIIERENKEDLIKQDRIPQRFLDH